MGLVAAEISEYLTGNGTNQRESRIIKVGLPVDSDCDVPIFTANLQWKTKSHPLRCAFDSGYVHYLQQLVESTGCFGCSRLLTNLIVLQVVIIFFLVADQNVLSVKVGRQYSQRVSLRPTHTFQ